MKLVGFILLIPFIALGVVAGLVWEALAVGFTFGGAALSDLYDQVNPPRL